MPKFTITTDAGDGPDAFDQPLDFPSAKAATADAKVALTEMARERLPENEEANLAVAIRDEAGTEIYRAGLHFEAQAVNGPK
ncbi:hypothetical protein [Bosea sp. AAP35]|uniref:DUF6894 family protein n=1 Tax=Bosea sp. AAP35 TaxID=1523417 RepID=UPI0012E2A4B5|nr:hypothetical protein [Bosea sp. AAP35]